MRQPGQADGCPETKHEHICSVWYDPRRRHAEARKTVKTTRPDPKKNGQTIELTVDEWMHKVGVRADQIMAGTKVKQLSPLFDAPQYAEQFIELARKSGKCRDMRIRTKAVLVDAKGKPVINPKTKAPKVGFAEWPPKQELQAA